VPNSPIIPPLANAPWLTRPETQAVLAALKAAGHEGRIVGGAVRNALMGKPVADIDIATPATPEQVMQAAAKAGLHVIPTGLQHGTVTVVSDHVPHEVTTLRRDVTTDGRHATVAFTQDWAADAARRDFTINALYCDAGGTVHDPLGGYPDLVARRVRFIGSPDARIAEDYLRILRFFRFHAEFASGPPDTEGLAACVRGRDGLARLSAERIRAEVLKLILAPCALEALEAMATNSLLAPVFGGAPRLADLARLIAIETALAVSPEPIRRLGCLALRREGDASRFAERLRLSNDERAMLGNLDNPAARSLPAAMGDDGAAKPLLYGMGAHAWRDAALVQWAWSAAPPSDDKWRQLATLPERWPIPIFPLKGGDLVALGCAPGPRIGEVLRQLEAQWITGGFEGDRDHLLALARDAIAKP
jgi:poly(A) polymerase